MNELGAEPRVGARKRGLGMGLSALLGNARDRANAEGVHMVPIEFLRPAALQPRRYFGEDELAALTESIRARGVMQPLLVRRLPDGGGELRPGVARQTRRARRYRAPAGAPLHRPAAVEQGPPARHVGDVGRHLRGGLRRLLHVA